MNSHYLRKITGEIVYVKKEDAKQVQNDLENGVEFWYNGSRIDPKKVDHFKAMSDGAAGPHQVGEATYARLPEGKRSTGFWELVISLNRQRQAERKPWISARAITEAKKQSSFTRPEDLFEFIDSEWEHFQPLNTFELPVDREAKRLISEYLKTEEGMRYTNSMRLFS